MNPSIQVRGITSIFHSLGLNDNKIINLCDDLNQNGLLFNLITKSGNYNLDAIGNSVTANSKIYKNDSNKQIREQANLYESNNQKAERIFGSLLGSLAGEQNDMLEEMARFEKYWKEKHPKDELLNEKGEPEEIDTLLHKKKKKKSNSSFLICPLYGCLPLAALFFRMSPDEISDRLQMFLHPSC